MFGKKILSKKTPKMFKGLVQCFQNESKFRPLFFSKILTKHQRGFFKSVSQLKGLVHIGINYHTPKAKFFKQVISIVNQYPSLTSWGLHGSVHGKKYLLQNIWRFFVFFIILSFFSLLFRMASFKSYQIRHSN